MSAPKYTDGYYGVPKRTSRTPYEYPFRQNGDITTRSYDAFYVVDINHFTPTASGTEDPENAGHYLLTESVPEIVQGDLATFRRTYSKIPLTQTVPDNLTIPKPELTGDFPQPIGEFLVFKPDETKAVYDAYTVKLVTSDSGPVVSIYPTGGTYTLTFAGNTTGAIAYNASSGTVQTALNALTSITNQGGVTVTGSYNTAGGLVVSFNSYASTTMTSSLTVSSGTVYLYLTATNGGFTQNVIIQTTTFGDITGGTFTLTIFGQTTAAIAYNASAATVQSALNALSGVSNRGGCTIALYPGFGGPAPTTILASTSQIIFTISFTNAVITANPASLTPVGSSVTPAITDGAVGRAQKITFVAGAAARTLYVSDGHDIESGGTIYIKADSTYYSGIADYTVTDTNTITLVGADSAAYNGAAVISEVGALTINYTPEPKQTRVKYRSDFYLPGVTPGIVTADDIPLLEYQGDPTTLLAAIFSGASTINYQVGGFKPYRESAMIERISTTLNPSQL
jgi:hypothetical protein